MPGLGLAQLRQNRRVQAIVAAVVLKVSLDAAYAWVVPTTHYYALLGTHLSVLKLVESYPLIVIGLIALPAVMRKVSTLILWLIALLMLVPMGTIYAFQDQPRAFMYATTAFFVLTGILVRVSPDLRLPNPPDWVRARGSSVFYGLLVAIAVAVIVIYSGTTLLGNIARLNLDLSGSYVDRADFVAAGLPLKGYYFPWLALVFNPVFLVIAVLKRRWWTIPLLLLLQFAIASEVGARSYFLDLPFVLGVALTALLANPPRLMAYIAAAAVFLSAVGTVVLKAWFPFDFITGRFLLVPSQLNFLYYDFFSNYGVIPGQYVFRFFLKVPYPVPYRLVFSPPNVIGGFYYHAPFNFAITGILGDSYMNLGFAGMVLGALVLVLVLKGLDAVSVGLDRRIAVAAAVMPAVAITETFLVRVIFTTGLLLMFLLLYALPRPTQGQEAPAEKPRNTRDPLKILILTQYFPPEVGAAQIRLFNFARTLIESGHECRVVTAMPNYPGGRVLGRYRRRWTFAEKIGAVPVARSAILAVRASDARRMAAYLSFQLSSLPVLVGMVRHYRPDYLFIESPPLFLGLSGVVLKRVLGVPFVFNVADLWPDWAAEIGAIRPSGVTFRLAHALERFIYREADFVTIVVARMADALAAKGVPAEKILFLPNGVNMAEFTSRAHQPGSDSVTAGAIKTAAGERFVVLYAGTLGAYHGLQVALDAAAMLRDLPVLFAFVGDGSEKKRLVASAHAMQLENIRFYDPVPADEIPALLAMSAIALSVIKIPTRAAKIMPAMAAGVPIVYAGRGEGAELVADAEAGLVVDPDRPEEIARAVTQLIVDRAKGAQLGANGRRYAVENLDWKRLVGAWVSSLESRRDRRSATLPRVGSVARRAAD